MLALAAGLGAVYVVSAQDKAASLLVLSTSLLRELSRFGEVIASAWLVALVVLILLFGPQFRAFLDRLTNVEVQGVKLSTGDMKALLPALDPGTWCDRPVGGANADVPGGDGPLLDKPDDLTPDLPQYKRCMAALPQVIGRLNMSNQAEVGKELHDLEWAWQGDFAEELGLSVQLLRLAVQDGRIIHFTDKYLVTALLLRHMMLYLHGQTVHLAQLLTDLGYASAEYATETMSHAYSMWFLIYLCEHGRYREVAQIAGAPLMQEPRCRWAREAYLAYLDLSAGRYAEAVGRAVAILKADPGNADAAPAALLHFVAAHGYLYEHRPLDAVGMAEAILRETGLRNRPLRNYLQQGARRILTRACYLARWHDRLYRLYTEDPDSAADPYVLNTLAVMLHNAGESRGARELLNRALRLLPRTGAAEVRESIERNVEILN